MYHVIKRTVWVPLGLIALCLLLAALSDSEERLFFQLAAAAWGLVLAFGWFYIYDPSWLPRQLSKNFWLGLPVMFALASSAGALTEISDAIAAERSIILGNAMNYGLNCSVLTLFLKTTRRISNP